MENQESHIFIDGIGLSGYRSFGDEVQRIGPFGKINLFIGKNNSGKSNIISFLKDYYVNIRHYVLGDYITTDDNIRTRNQNKVDFVFSPLDYHYSSNNKKSISIIIEIGFSIENQKKLISCLFKLNRSRLSECSKSFELFEKLLTSPTLFDKDKELLWFSYFDGKKLKIDRILEKFDGQEILSLSTEEWKKLWLVVHNKPTSSDHNLQIMKDVFVRDVLDTINRATQYIKPPNIAMIPAIRKIGEAVINRDKLTNLYPNDFSGIGIINNLFQLQNPVQNQNILDEYQQKKKKFEDINHFLQTVTNSPRARIEIPHDESTILVHMDDKILPLSSLGTGIHEVIILAAAATVLENQVICMEEPELHLHPLLQKKLIRYLQEHTNNQYFITTHSAHLLDTPNVAIFHVRNEDGQSIVESVTTNNSKFSICSDLGYKTSDLLQSNCIIWVEGPSDRIYLNYWINLLDKSLKEGIDYTIMFYGGSLISHLSASDIEINDQIEDEEITNFISLLKINRNMVIMCDSDREKDEDPLKQSPQRLQDKFQFESFPGVWITHGREVENYLNPKIVEEAIKKVHSRSNFKSLAGEGIYDFFWKYTTTNSEEEKETDKVKRKKEIIKKYPKLDSDAIEKLILQEEFKEADKVKIAKKIVEQYPDSDFEKIAHPDLKEKLEEKIKELIKFIKNSNHIDPN